MSPSKKRCMVCGDNALGYNFNAITCESCKAFFRRNALLSKEFTCPFSNSCEITVITRRFCQRCRLEKCLKIGMKKEHIMSEEDKMQKKRKIEQNRAKRKADPFIDENILPKIKREGDVLSNYETWETNERGDDEATSFSQQSPSDFNSSSNMSGCTSPNTPASTSIVANTMSEDVMHATSSSTAQEIVESICRQPENAALVISRLMKNSKDAVDILGKIIDSPADAMKLISHLISYPGDALKIISKIMNSPFHALTVFTKFMSSPTDALEIITKIVSSPADVLQFIQQLMSHPTDAIQIMNKFMSAPAEALKMINRMVNPTQVDSTTETCEPNSHHTPENVLVSNTNVILNAVLNAAQSPNSSSSLSPEPKFESVKLPHKTKPSTETICPPLVNSNTLESITTSATSVGVSSSSNGSSKPDAMKNIFEDVEDRPIQPNSIESVLCEAIKLEYEAFNSISQTVSENRALNKAEQSKLNELLLANKALYFPVDDDLSSLISEDERIKCDGNQQDPQLLNVINLTAVAIRRLIKMSKKIIAFRNMCQEDQVALLKGGCTEMMIMRSVMSYDCDLATWKIPHSKEAMSNIKVDVLKLAKGNVYEEHERFIRTFDPKWRMDENIILIMCAIVLFTPNRPRVIHSDVIKLEQNSYYYLLRRYLESVYPGCEAKSTFIKLIQKIGEVQRLNDVIIGVYLNVNPSHVEPLLREIFDLKNH